jgi:nucleolar protein 56
VQELVGDDAVLAEHIIERSKFSMGNDLNQVDESSMLNFARYIIEHFDYKHQLQNYLKDQMNNVAPNLTELLGESVGARLMTHAGGLNNLAKLPASTIQILGAEKALFRALKTKSSTPKYGLLFNSSFISRATTQRKGKISRLLSNACAKSSRLDNFLINVL